MAEIQEEQSIIWLLRDLMTVELAKACCTNEEIRKIVKVQNNRESGIAGPVRKAIKRSGQPEA
ncbi:MAG TPA: hypothetical protein VEH48_01035 [Candidatus Nitrosopolaris sp.]|nr:hypothetical protein [Candidatus Nitrosopolaris sp.]